MDMANAHFVKLIIDELGRIDPGLLPAGVSAPDTVRRSHVEAARKSDLLEHAYAKSGPHVILAVGQGIKRAGFAPILHILLASSSPVSLTDKWQLLERYGHSRNRTKIEELAGGALSFSRYAQTGAEPAVTYNLAICGLLIGLLEALGCRGLRCRLGPPDKPDLLIYDDGSFPCQDKTAVGTAAQWIVQWQDFQRTAEISRTDPQTLPRKAFGLDFGLDGTGLAKKAAAMISDDLLRRWTIADVADHIGQSRRTLQRRLTEAGMNFSILVRAIRIHEACCMLTDTDASLTEIGYCCGFADSAHFTRDFGASTKMSPSEFRRQSTAGRYTRA